MYILIIASDLSKPNSANYLLFFPAPPIFELDPKAKNIVVKSGHSFRIPVFIDGSPQPEVTWLREDERVLEDLVTKLEHSEYTTALCVSSASRTHAGKYRMKLQNEYGQCEAEMTVTVLDVPGPPKGKLFGNHFDTLNQLTWIWVNFNAGLSRFFLSHLPNLASKISFTARFQSSFSEKLSPKLFIHYNWYHQTKNFTVNPRICYLMTASWLELLELFSKLFIMIL